MDLSPIIPFEPISTYEIPQGENWIAQIKWDGVRVLTYYDGKEVKLYNRKINERTYHYPEVCEISSFCKANSVILDGEIIALGPDGLPSFHEVMRRDGIRRLERVKEIQKYVSITYMIFDVVYFNGKWIDQAPLRERMDVLSDIVKPNEYVQLVTSHQDADILYDVMKQKQVEGILLKDIFSKYAINKKNDRWQKKKNYRDVIAVVGGVTFNNGVVNALLLGLYNQEGELIYIGHAGTGKMTREEWTEITKLVKPMITKSPPFLNRPGRLKGAYWIEPVITVKVKFMEWTENMTLRQPSIQGFINAPAETCTFLTSL